MGSVEISHWITKFSTGFRSSITNELFRNIRQLSDQSCEKNLSDVSSLKIRQYIFPSTASKANFPLPTKPSQGNNNHTIHHQTTPNIQHNTKATVTLTNTFQHHINWVRLRCYIRYFVSDWIVFIPLYSWGPLEEEEEMQKNVTIRANMRLRKEF